MGSGDSLYPLDWRATASKDWRRLGVMLGENDAEAAAFFLQQCLEKYLKSYLLSKGWALRKIHQLDALLDDAVRFDRSLETYRSLCERVAAYYFAGRYPQLQATGLTPPDVEADREEARRFITALFPDEQLP